MIRIINSFKIFLWKLGLYNDNCPFCHNKLLGHGFGEYGMPAYYTCETKECEFK